MFLLFRWQKKNLLVEQLYTINKTETLTLLSGKITNKSYQSCYIITFLLFLAY